MITRAIEIHQGPGVAKVINEYLREHSSLRVITVFKSMPNVVLVCEGESEYDFDHSKRTPIDTKPSRTTDSKAGHSFLSSVQKFIDP